jgi:3-hydroxyisobutyrate dehydrogenase-like beta-hydroxyacid dehydrogenase
VSRRRRDRSSTHPVSGGVAKAETGELSVMVGARTTTTSELEPLLTAFASVVFLVGPDGRGTVAKLVNNQLFLGAAVVVQEAYLLAAAHGSSRRTCTRSSRRAPPAYAALAPLLLGGRFDDVVFRLDIAAKDARAAGRGAGCVPP